MKHRNLPRRRMLNRTVDRIIKCRGRMLRKMRSLEIAKTVMKLYSGDSSEKSHSNEKKNVATIEFQIQRIHREDDDDEALRPRRLRSFLSADRDLDLGLRAGGGDLPPRPPLGGERLRPAYRGGDRP